jgi:hypothetical protein
MSWRRTLTVAAALAGCAESRPTREAVTPSRSPRGCTQDLMADNVMTFQETTNPTLSDHEVGISNIFERELPDAGGNIAKRLSAVLVIFDPASQQSRRETVAVDSVVTIGTDRYCVVGLQAGTGQPGSISMRKLAR